MNKTTATIICFSCLCREATIAKKDKSGNIIYQLPKGWWVGIQFFDVETTTLYCPKCGEEE